MKILTSFEIFSKPDGLVGKPNRMDWLGNRTCRFIWLGFPEWHFGYFALFVLVLGHPESELHSVYFIRFLSL